MIEVEGYRAFRGTLRITPINPRFPKQVLYGDWLYKPEFGCWYGRGSSYDADICEIVSDETEKK